MHHSLTRFIGLLFCNRESTSGGSSVLNAGDSVSDLKGPMKGKAHRSEGCLVAGMSILSSEELRAWHVVGAQPMSVKQLTGSASWL